MSFLVKFWGVRGSIACPTADHIRYGGNTTCVEMRLGDRRLIFDAGTGIRDLGQDFVKNGATHIDLLMTHTHWDHINGFPFFTPAYGDKYTLNIWAGHLKDAGHSIKEILSTQMNNPMFPVPLEAMQAKLSFNDFSAGETLDIGGGMKVRTAPLMHPNGATGYRVDWDGKSACLITDTEHKVGELDQNILGLIEGADLVIYDSTYTEEEFPSKVGWGHSTWNQGMKLCKEAGVGRLAIFHHDPDHNDAFMEKLEEEAVSTWEGCFVAREGMDIHL